MCLEATFINLTGTCKKHNISNNGLFSLGSQELHLNNFGHFIEALKLKSNERIALLFPQAYFK